jgi:hypothetical protein
MRFLIDDYFLNLYMNLENSTFESRKELKPKSKVEVEVGYENFVPEEFRQDPLSYFESRGKNIKTGEVKSDETGRVYEDPTAVKELPTWTDVNSVAIQTIGKRVNIKKGKVGESGDPFYEYRVMEIMNNVGLSAPKPVAKVEQAGIHLIIMEKVQGIGWHDKDKLHLKEKGYTDKDMENLKQQAEQQMLQLQVLFEEAGIKRGWKLKDMIFDLDIERKIIKKITPVDWERTKIDQRKLAIYREKLK